MGKYTDFFEDKSYNILDEEDYIQELKDILDKFRTFDEALDSFIVEHGFKGNLDSIDEKVKFISEKCKQANVPVPRNLKDWYIEDKKPDRTSKVPFQICFAFELNVDEVNDFLHRICLFRGFDCHIIEEIVYFFAFKHGLDYTSAMDILSKVKTVKPVLTISKCENIATQDIVYTHLIIDEIESIETEEELIEYLNENIDKFEYNNATAYKVIQTIWKDISGDNKKEGIAIREKRLLYKEFNKDEDENYISKTGRKERKRTDDSIWEIYLQILGLSGSCMAGFYNKRSLKFMLNDNEMLHPLAQDCFPDRDGLNKVLNGVHVSYERVRKLLILLVFYKYYAEKALEKTSYFTDIEDADRCICIINDKLVCSNYSALYPANPYDFLILMSIRTEYPLITFREYMQELFYEKVDIDSLYKE